MMATGLSDPNEAGLKRTTATQGDSSCERNVPLWEPPGLNPYTGVFILIWERTAPWEFCVESIYGSFSSLYGSAAVNALQPGHKVHTLCSADNTCRYIRIVSRIKVKPNPPVYVCHRGSKDCDLSPITPMECVTDPGPICVSILCMSLTYTYTYTILIHVE